MNDWQRAEEIVELFLDREAHLRIPIKILLLKLESNEALTRDDRRSIAALLNKVLKSPKALKALERPKQRGQRRHDRHLDMAFEYLARLELGASTSNAKATVATRWSVEPGTVADALTHRRGSAQRVLKGYRVITPSRKLHALLQSIVDRPPGTARRGFDFKMRFAFGEIEDTILR